jgi:hypothetical protein
MTTLPRDFFSKAPTDNPRYKAAKPACPVPESLPGMRRIHPSVEQVDAIWSLLDPPEKSYIEYWFEDGKGNAQISITDGESHWEAELLLIDGKYVPANNEWGLETVCIG